MGIEFLLELLLSAMRVFCVATYIPSKDMLALTWKRVLNLVSALGPVVLRFNTVMPPALRTPVRYVI
eukprot:102712-Pyramimonas_sp.AAC.1